MSDSESDDGSANWSRRRGNNKNRKIVMRIEFDDSDESSGSGGDSGEDDPIRPCGSAQKRNRGWKRLVSSDEDDPEEGNDSSSGSEIARTVVVRGRRMKKSVIVEEEPADEASTSTGARGCSAPAAGSQSIVMEDVGFASDSSNDDTLEKCPICLLSLRNQEIGNPSICDHQFCAICIEEWSKNVTTCPIDRRAFDSIIVHESFSNRKFLREIKIEPPKCAETAENGAAEEGLTFCQVCNQSNREEVMLLCDGCNQGYHMDCLNPPLLEVPEGFWYCDCCFESEEEDVQEDLNLLYEDLREMGVPETRLRIREVRQPRIPRTRQSERIRAEIVARTRTSSSRITSEINFTQQPGSSSRLTTTARTTTTTSTQRRRTKKRRTRRGQRQRRTYVVEYDVDNYDEKFQIKTKKIIRKRKSSKRTGRRRRRKTTSRSTTTTVSSRKKTTHVNEFLTRANSSVLASQSFSLFGNRNDLDYFSDDDSDSNVQAGEGSESGLGSGGGAAVQTSVRIRSVGPGSALNRRKGIIRDLDQPRQADVLSSIMDMQDRFLNATRHNQIGSVRIGADGSLSLPDVPPIAVTKQPEKSDAGEKQVPPEDINQAPMYPRGGNHNYSNNGGGSYNNRFNSQSNYRNSTGSNAAGGGFRANASSAGAGGSGGGGGFMFNAFHRDNNNFQLDNNFQQPRNNNLDNSSPNLRGRFRQNQQQNQQQLRRNLQNRYSGPPALQQHNENQNRSLIDIPTSPFNVSAPPPLFAGLNQQPPPLQHPPQQLPLQQLPPPPIPPQQFPPFTQINAIDSISLPATPSSNFIMNSNNSRPALYSSPLVSVPIQPMAAARPLPVYGPMNFSGPDPPYEEPPTPPAPIVAPLAPPPWNKNLFRLTSDYGDDDDDDDADCPNLSVYSAESFQVARSSENVEDSSGSNAAGAANSQQNQTADSEKVQQQEDEFEEKEEDLVQLGDDDDIPDAIESGNSNKEASESEIYEPENPTEELAEGATQSEKEETDDDDEENEKSHTPEKIDEEQADDNDDDAEEDKDENDKNQSLNSSENISTEKIENDDEEDEDSEATQDKKITKEEKLSRNKKGVLELYDDSDWDEWNIEKTESIPMPPEPQQKAKSPTPTRKDEDRTPDNDETKTPEPAEKIQTESISEDEEEERSYTPCLDEKTEHDEVNGDNSERGKSKSVDRDKTEGDRTDVSTAVIDGMETELISEEDEDVFNQDQNKPGGSANKRDDKRKNDASGSNKRSRKEQFKKISKSTKVRNYRDKDNRLRSRKRSRNRSRSRSNDKENQNGPKNDRRRINKRKDIERYDVRNVIGQPKTFKDRYGRDTSRPARSKSKSKSRSPRRPRTKSRTRSISSKNDRRSFSMSPTPVSIGRASPRRRMFSPRRSRSRRRSRSIRRSPIGRNRTRSPLRLRSRSNSGVRQNGRRQQQPNRFRRRSLSRSISRSRTPRLPSLRKSRSRSISRPKNKLKRSKDRKRKRMKKRPASGSPSPPPPRKRMQRPVELLGGARKKKRRTRTKSPAQRAWSHSAETAAPPVGNESWTPPLVGSNSNNLTVILKNKELAAANKRKRDKKKRAEKRRELNSRKEKRRQRSEIRESPVAPSKEVFASGDNILVSVSFNKDGNMAPQQQTTVVTLPPTREEIISKRRSPERKQKKSKEKSQRRHKKTDAKPVAIIDLDRSPFQVITESPRDVIVLTDSDREEEDDTNKRKNNNNNSEVEPNEHTVNEMQIDSIDKSTSIERPETIQEESFEMQQLGPKTPPEPPTIKFSLAKTKQIKARNPLHDEQEELEHEAAEEEHVDSDTQEANKIGPNTPPESGPCSPDAYDPFDPTKSPSASPTHSTTPPPGDLPAETSEIEPHTTESNTVETRTTASIQDKNMNPVEFVMALMTSKANKSQELLNLSAESGSYNLSKSDVSESLDISDENNGSVPKSITVLSNVLISTGKSQQRSAPIIATSPPISKSQSQNQTKLLPLPKATTSSNRQNGGGGSSDDLGGGINEIESPYSPGSDDYEDLFEPPPIDNSVSLAQISRNRSGKSSKKAEMFDNLFGSSTPPARFKRRKGGNKSSNNKKTAFKGGKKLDDDQIKIFDELPSSAVELQVKDKFLRKLNRQERVVEEVKLVLKPHYNKKRITKDDYKDILRRAVPKICHSRSGEINPNKIKNLIEAYVRKFRQRNKLGIMGTGQVSSAVKCAAYLKKL